MSNFKTAIGIKLIAFSKMASSLKTNRKTLKILIGFNFIWAAVSIYADWPWLMSVPLHLLPFTPICSIYPLLLTIWYILYGFQESFWQKNQKVSTDQEISQINNQKNRTEKGHGKRFKIPAWFTAFVFIGCGTYGIMAQVYYPLFMSWPEMGINFHDVASMVWVALYGIQTFAIASELRRLPAYQWALVIGYFAFKDFSDYFYKTFIDFLIPGYPVWIINTLVVAMLMVQPLIIFTCYKISRKNSVKNLINPSLSVEPALETSG